MTFDLILIWIAHVAYISEGPTTVLILLFYSHLVSDAEWSFWCPNLPEKKPSCRFLKIALGYRVYRLLTWRYTVAGGVTGVRLGWGIARHARRESVWRTRSARSTMRFLLHHLQVKWHVSEWLTWGQDREKKSDTHQAYRQRHKTGFQVFSLFAIKKTSYSNRTDSSCVNHRNRRYWKVNSVLSLQMHW